MENGLRHFPFLPYLVLLRVGFAMPRGITVRAVRSYRTFSPLPQQSNISGLAGLRLLCLRIRLKADWLAPFTLIQGFRNGLRLLHPRARFEQNGSHRPLTRPAAVYFLWHFP